MKETIDVLLLALTHFVQDRVGWETYLHLESIVEDSASHFVLASITGLLVCLLILTMFSVVFGTARILSRSRVSPTLGARRFIIGLALCCGFLAGWASHTGLDYFTVWYNTPLGPSLTLILK